MATFEAQVEAITGIAIESSGSSPTQAELTQFLTDGAKEVIYNMPYDMLTYTSQVVDVAAGSTATLSDSPLISVERSDGFVYKKCRKIPLALSGLAEDPDEMIFATQNDPVYYLKANSLNVLPLGGAWRYHKVLYPSVAFNGSDIGTFPNEAEYIVVLYAAIKSLESALTGEEDTELYLPTITQIKDDYQNGLKALRS